MIRVGLARTAPSYAGLEPPYGPGETYPEMVSHCDYCGWWSECEKRRRGDDHLCYVAGISGAQIKSLRALGIQRLAELAVLDPVLAPTPPNRFICNVWLGHLADLQGAREKAVAHYQAALAVDHDEVHRHGQYDMKIDRAWAEQRLQTPFERDEE